MIGDLVGTSVTHDAQYTVTATFDIPANEAQGTKDAVVTFAPPEGTLTFSMAGGFTVEAADSAPTVTQQPVSQTAAPAGTISFSVSAFGSEPISYQWQKDAGDIPGATNATLTLNPVWADDTGAYRCLVSNTFGTTISTNAVLTVAARDTGVFPIVETNQLTCFDDTGAMSCPGAGTAFDGQDAQYAGNFTSYTVSGDGLTVVDAVTGLTWQRSPDTDGDGDIDAADKFTWTEAQVYPDALNAEMFGGFDDWRLPTIKELYSLIDFNGTDPSNCETEAACPNLVPFIDDSAFEYAYGDTAAGERVIDSQYASSTVYVSTVDGGLLFGVNFADGRIKGYWYSIGGTEKTFFVICVRGTVGYGVNNFVDNGDGTITDRATGLMWMQDDNGSGLLWEDALTYAENLTFAGYDDWRLPDAKELQGLLDYSRSPDTTASAAIDPIFNATSITNEEGAADYPYYWSSTTHMTYGGGGGFGSYIAFGRGLGYWNGAWRDVHGAGCQRSDPKIGDPADYPEGHGPQGDAIRIYNHVRAVRGCSGRRGDFNCDGAIDLADFIIMANAYAGPDAYEAPAQSTVYDFAKCDLEGDGDVDLQDVAEFLTRVGL
jgi:lysozyme family protein